MDCSLLYSSASASGQPCAFDAFVPLAGCEQCEIVRCWVMMMAHAVYQLGSYCVAL